MPTQYMAYIRFITAVACSLQSLGHVASNMHNGLDIVI